MNNLRKILFYADGAKSEAAALKRAYRFAVDNAAELVVMGVVQAVSTSDPRLQKSIDQVQKTLMSERGIELDGLIAGIQPVEGKPARVSKFITAGKDYVEVIRKASSGKFDLLVKAINPASAIRTTLFGSVDIRLAHYCPCPVMILKPCRRKHYRSVLVAIDPVTDASETRALNHRLLQMGAAVAEVEESALHLVHVLDSSSFDSKSILKDKFKMIEQSLKEDAERQLKEMVSGVTGDISDHVIKGKPHKAIAKFVADNDVDLLVMGSVARSGVPGLLVGNTAERIINHVDCSILVVKPGDWKTPVS